jgi:hypothetical protein
MAIGGAKIALVEKEKEITLLTSDSLTVSLLRIPTVGKTGRSR